MPTVASYCTTFLKPEMLHIYRQISGLRRWKTFVITKERQCEDRFPMPEGDVEIAPKVRSNFARRFWLKYVKKEPPIVYRGEYGVLAGVLERRHADEMAAIARLNTRALDVLAAMGGEEKGDEKQSSRSLRKRKGQDTTAEDSTISPPNQKKSRK